MRPGRRRGLGLHDDSPSSPEVPGIRHRRIAHELEVRHPLEQHPYRRAQLEARERRTHAGVDAGPERDMLPSEQAMERARQILDMLRARAGETGLPKFERDYIDRLLRGLY